VIAVNLLAHVEVTRLVVSQMIERRSGLVVNVASMAATYPLAWLAPYCVSKAALKSYTLCLANELHPYGIRSNAVGITARTDLLDSHIEQKKERGYYQQRTPRSLDDFPSAEENIAPVLFLASEEGKHITGQYFECHSTLVPTWR
jgi:NAD(P)-dependent dehydrogenase (short-subunit alcohol dehydrogenase family)